MLDWFDFIFFFFSNGTSSRNFDWDVRMHAYASIPNPMFPFAHILIQHLQVLQLFSSFFFSTSYRLAPLYSHPHPFAVCAPFHSVFFISTLASLLVTLSPFVPSRLSFLTWFPLSHLHHPTEMGIIQKQWGGCHFYITFTLSNGEDVRGCNACNITMIWTILLARHTNWVFLSSASSCKCPQIPI